MGFSIGLKETMDMLDSLKKQKELGQYSDIPGAREAYVGRDKVGPEEKPLVGMTIDDLRGRANEAPKQPAIPTPAKTETPKVAVEEDNRSRFLKWIQERAKNRKKRKEERAEKGDIDNKGLGRLAALRSMRDKEVDPARKAQIQQNMQDLLRGLIAGGSGAFAVMGKDPGYLKRSGEVWDKFKAGDKKRALMDPESRDSQILRSELSRLHPDMLKKFPEITGAEILEYDLLNPKMSVEDKLALAGRNSEADRREANFQISQASKYVTATEDERKMLGGLNQLEQLVTEISGEPFYFEDYDGQDMPGNTFLGYPLGFDVKSEFTNEQAQEFRALESRIKNRLVNALSGAAVSDKEYARIAKEFNQSYTGSESDRMRALRNLKIDILKIMNDKEEVYRQSIKPGGETVIDKYKGRTTSDFAKPTDDLVGRANEAPKSSGGRMGRAKEIKSEKYIIREKDGVKYKFDPVTKENLGAL